METLVVLFSIFSLCFGEVTRYDFYQEYRVVPQSNFQAELLNNIQRYSVNLKFSHGTSIPGKDIAVIVPPHQVNEFLTMLKLYEIPFHLVTDNLQSLIDIERAAFDLRSNDFNWNSYRSLNEIYAWLDGLPQQFPNVVEVINYGTTYEKRIIKGIKISYKSGNPGVFIEGGIHAREWISPATVTYIINELLASNDTAVRNIAENVDWYIVPVFNPDGYLYTFSNDRMWRKTRSVSLFCYGADPNRNFDSRWNTVGASSFPCAETYAGRRAFSEVETKSVSDYLMKIKGKINIYVSFHAYSQLLMYPYGYTDAPVANQQQHNQIAASAVKSLAKRYGTKYGYGPVYTTIYPVSGDSTDWAYDTLKVNYTFTYELRPATEGAGGFILPAEQIIPCGEETLDSIVTIIEESKKLGLP